MATPNPKRPLPLPNTRIPPDIPHLTLSLTFDVLRSEVKGTLGRDADAQLGLLDDQYQQKYLYLIEQKVQSVLIRDRETAIKAKIHKLKKLCKREG